MKHNPRQLPLFFTLEPSPDEIRLCPRCGRQIIVQRRLPDGTIMSEYQSKDGCFECSMARKVDRRGLSLISGKGEAWFPTA